MKASFCWYNKNMSLTGLTLIVNSIFLVAATLATIWMARLGAQNTYYYGITEKTDAIKWKIIKIILFLITIGLISSVFNLVISFFDV